MDEDLKKQIELEWEIIMKRGGCRPIKVAKKVDVNNEDELEEE